MKKTFFVLVIIILLAVIFYYYNKNKAEEITAGENISSAKIIPITHATAIIEWGDENIYTDPTGGEEAFFGKSPADIILVTDIHGDHLSTSTLTSVIGNATLIVPKAVHERLPASLASIAKIMNNGEVITEKGYKITAVPMYNLPIATSSPHIKGRGNGYLIEKDDFRVYVAGDTSGIPEMRGLTGIDIALIPMNLPFTMGVEEAASAVLDFKPIKVYPYHYRGQEGLSDINKFKQLVNSGNPNIEVVLENWYPAI